MRKFIRREKIDLVHVHRGKDHWISGLGAWLAGVPVVRTRHVVTPVKRHPFNQWLYGRVTRAVISVSDAADRSLGTLRERVGIRRTILSAVDWHKFNPSARSDAWRAAHSRGCVEPIWIGLIGRIQAIKGQKYFMRGARIIAEKYPQAWFLVAGRGNPEKTKKSGEYAKKHGFGDRLLVEGHLENLPETMASLDIGVVASVGSEGSSRVTMEYMASGVPVVATRVGGIPEILRANERGEAELGVLVPPRDPEALAAAIMGLIENEVERRRLAQAGLRAIHESHDPDKWAEAVERIYYEILEERE